MMVKMKEQQEVERVCDSPIHDLKMNEGWTARKFACDLLALLGQLVMILAAARIASHSYAHHGSDLLMKSFCLMVMVLSIMWFRTTFQGANKTYESFGSGLEGS